MLRCLLALGLVSSSLCIPALAQPEQGGAHLVLAFSRGPLNQQHQTGLTHSSVVMTMPSMAQCREEGNKATKRNTKEVRTVFWCIQR